MKKLIILVAALVLGSPSFVCAADPWSKTDVALQVVYSALHIADWGQTQWIRQNPSINHYSSSENPNGSVSFSSWKTYRQEGNPILGHHPSSSKINTYFASTLIAHAVISHFLPGKYRTAWQGATITFEGYIVGKNAHAGVGFRF